MAIQHHEALPDDAVQQKAWRVLMDFESHDPFKRASSFDRGQDFNPLQVVKKELRDTARREF